MHPRSIVVREFQRGEQVSASDLRRDRDEAARKSLLPSFDVNDRLAQRGGVIDVRGATTDWAYEQCMARQIQTNLATKPQLCLR